MKTNIEQEIFRYKKELTWSLPILFQYEPCWGAIYKLCKKHEINLPKINGYGSPANAWTGGRIPTIFHEIDKKILEKSFQYSIENNIIPTFAFTYSRIQKEDLQDRYANYLLDMGLEYGAHFIVNSDLLKNYIKEKDPNAYVVASITKAVFRFQGNTRLQEPTIENETNFYNELLKEYNLVVVRPEYSLNALLEHAHLINDISRIEVLINQPCVQNCPLMPEHYSFFENKRQSLNANRDKDFICYRKKYKPAYYLENNSIHSEESVKKLIDINVKHFKIQGRGMNYTLDSFAVMLMNQIFKPLGPSHILIMDLMKHEVAKEDYYYSKKVFQETD